MKKIIFTISAFLAMNAVNNTNTMSLKLVPRTLQKSIVYRIPGNTTSAKLEYLHGRAFNPKAPTESKKEINQMIRDILAEKREMEQITLEDFKRILDIVYFNALKKKITYFRMWT